MSDQNNIPDDAMKQGIQDPNLYDPNTQMPAPSPEKEVKIKFPRSIPDEMITTAARLGLQILKRCQVNIATLCFTQVSNVNGQSGWSVGTIEMGCLDENDIKRVTTLINEINKANTEMMNAAKNGQQSDIASALLAGTQKKDNALEAMLNKGAQEKKVILEP